MYPVIWVFLNVLEAGWNIDPTNEIYKDCEVRGDISVKLENKSSINFIGVST